MKSINSEKEDGGRTGAIETKDFKIQQRIALLTISECGFSIKSQMSAYKPTELKQFKVYF